MRTSAPLRELEQLAGRHRVVLGVGRVDDGLARRARRGTPRRRSGGCRGAARDDGLRAVAARRARPAAPSSRSWKVIFAPISREVDREARVVHLAGERLLERARDVVAAVEVDDVARHERGVEEREALDVIPVDVAEEEVRRERHLLQQRLAEQAKAGAAVEDEEEPCPRAPRRSSCCRRRRRCPVPGWGCCPRTPQKVIRIALRWRSAIGRLPRGPSRALAPVTAGAFGYEGRLGGRATRRPNEPLSCCVLGCRAGSATLARRARAARDAFVSPGRDPCVACGGRAWGGRRRGRRARRDAARRRRTRGGDRPRALLRSTPRRTRARGRAPRRARALHEVVRRHLHVAPRRAPTRLFRARRAPRGRGRRRRPAAIPTLRARLDWHARERLVVVEATANAVDDARGRSASFAGASSSSRWRARGAAARSLRRPRDAGAMPPRAAPRRRRRRSMRSAHRAGRGRAAREGRSRRGPHEPRRRRAAPERAGARAHRRRRERRRPRRAPRRRGRRDRRRGPRTASAMRARVAKTRTCSMLAARAREPASPAMPSERGASPRVRGAAELDPRVAIARAIGRCGGHARRAGRSSRSSRRGGTWHASPRSSGSAISRRARSSSAPTR